LGGYEYGGAEGGSAAEFSAAAQGKGEYERELDWDDEVRKESEHAPLPDGEYEFAVLEVRRAHFGGSDKMPPCNKAELKLSVWDGRGNKGTIQHSLFLHTRTEWKICEFFTAIGARKRGEPMRMDWARVPNARGRVKIGTRKYMKDGEERSRSEARQFIDPNAAAAEAPAAQYKPAAAPQPVHAAAAPPAQYGAAPPAQYGAAPPAQYGAAPPAQHGAAPAAATQPARPAWTPGSF
jgi:hypothetical protein